MKLISWNVNGLRACLGKGFLDFCAVADADIICLQETKMRPEQAEFDLPGYHRYWNSADKAGYSGTAVFTRRQPLSVTYDFGIDEHRHEGRVITAEYPGLLPGVLLHSKLQGSVGPAGLPHGLGGRHPGLPAGSGRQKACGVLRGPERGPPGDRYQKIPVPNRRNPGFYRRGAGEDDEAPLQRLLWTRSGICTRTRPGPTPGGATASTPGRTTPGGGSTTSSCRSG